MALQMASGLMKRSLMMLPTRWRAESPSTMISLMPLTALSESLLLTQTQPTTKLTMLSLTMSRLRTLSTTKLRLRT